MRPLTCTVGEREHAHEGLHTSSFTEKLLKTQTLLCKATGEKGVRQNGPDLSSSQGRMWHKKGQTENRLQTKGSSPSDSGVGGSFDISDGGWEKDGNGGVTM